MHHGQRAKCERHQQCCCERNRWHPHPSELQPGRVLLELRTKRAPQNRMQETVPEILLRMRQNWGTNTRLSSTGKRATGRERKRVGPADLEIRFEPRPMVTVNILGHTFDALLDSGSSRSFITQEVGQLCGERGHPSQDLTTPIRQRYGDTYTRMVQIPIKVGQTQTTQTFGVMPNLTLNVLIGIDLMARLGISIPAPPQKSRPEHLRMRYGPRKPRTTP